MVECSSPGAVFYSRGFNRGVGRCCRANVASRLVCGESPVIVADYVRSNSRAVP